MESSRDEELSINETDDRQQVAAEYVRLKLRNAVKLKLRNAELRSSLDLLSHEGLKLKEENRTLRNDVAAAVEERDAALSRIRELRSVLRHCRENARGNSAERARLRVEVERLQEENARLKSNFKKVKDDRDRFRDMHGGLETSLDHLKMTTERLSREKDELNRRLEERNDRADGGIIRDDIPKRHKDSWVDRSFQILTETTASEGKSGQSEASNDNNHDSVATQDTSMSNLSLESNVGRYSSENIQTDGPRMNAWISFSWDSWEKNKENGNRRVSRLHNPDNKSVLPHLPKSMLNPAKNASDNKPEHEGKIQRWLIFHRKLEKSNIGQSDTPSSTQEKGQSSSSETTSPPPDDTGPNNDKENEDNVTTEDSSERWSHDSASSLQQTLEEDKKQCDVPFDKKKKNQTCMTVSNFLS